MTLRSAIVVGGGVSGSCCAVALADRGWSVRVVDEGRETCSRQAGGMLAPLAEVDHAEVEVVRAGLDSVARWRALLGPHASRALRDGGSLLTALPPEWPLLDQLLDRITRAGLSERVSVLDRRGVGLAEPALRGRFARALHTLGEGVVDPTVALSALEELGRERGIARSVARVTQVGPGAVEVDGRRDTAALVVDARGLGARGDVPVRGVRGEFLEVVSRDVELSRPVRVLHPRHPLYVVPRGEGRYYVGATELERDDLAPPTVRAALELLGVLHAVHPAFADAEIVRMDVGRRPALPDNAPRIVHEPGLIRINGLHRHGWMLSPVLAEAVAAKAEGDEVPAGAVGFLEAA